jgi:hypothetical protein
MSNHRTTVEKAFRALLPSQRKNILTSWGVAGFADFADSMLPGVAHDIRDADPTAFGTVTAHRQTPKPNTASKLAEMADGIYVGLNAKGNADDDQPATDDLFEGSGAVIDPQEIYGRCNALSPKTLAARVKLRDA